MTPPHEVVRKRLKRVVVERGLTLGEVARRAGCHERTVERFLEGVTFSTETADRIATALRVNLDDDPRERLLAGLDLYQLADARGWWARQVDVARLLGVRREAVAKRVLRGLRGGQIEREEVRGNMRPDAMIPPWNHWPTGSHKPCTMLAASACVWLVLTAESEATELAMGAVIDEAVLRLRTHTGRSP